MSTPAQYVRKRVSSGLRPVSDTICYLSRSGPDDLGRLTLVANCVVFLPKDSEPAASALAEQHDLIFCDNPKYEYALSVSRLVRDQIIAPPPTRIAATATIGRGAAVGHAGFSFARDPNRPPIRMPHLGGLVIGDRVEIGALTTVCVGTMEPTVIEAHVKVDDHCHIGHNCYIERDAIITAGAVLGGGVRVGRGAWIGIQSVVKQHLTIGEGAVVGMGAAVFRDVPPGKTAIGNPARIVETVERP